MDDLGGSYRFTKDFVTCFCEVSLCSCESKKTIRLTDPTRNLPCPVLPFTRPFTALCCPFPALYCPLLPFTCPILPFIHHNGQWVTKRSSGYRLGIEYGIDCLVTYHTENYGIHAAAALTCHNR